MVLAEDSTSTMNSVTQSLSSPKTSVPIPDHDRDAKGSISVPTNSRKPTSDLREHLAPGEFVVERVLKYKRFNGVRHAQVKWLGYKETTWEPADQIFYCKTVDVPRVVETIIDIRRKNGCMQYKVRWMGEPPKNDRWVRKSKLSRPDLIVKFNEEHALGHKTKSKVSRNNVRAIEMKTTITPSFLSPSPGVPPRSRDETADIAKTISDIDMPPVNESAAARKKMSSHWESVGVSITQPVPAPVNNEIEQEKSEKMQESPVLDSNTVPASPVEKWSVSELADVLTENGFREAAEKLRHHDVDGTRLLKSLDPAFLRKMDIPFGHGLKIIKLIRDLNGVTHGFNRVRVIL